MKYQVGTKVMIVSSRENNPRWNLSGLMDKWLGKIMTIEYVGPTYYSMCEDATEGINGRGWFWDDSMIDHAVTETESLGAKCELDFDSLIIRG